MPNAQEFLSSLSHWSREPVRAHVTPAVLLRADATIPELVERAMGALPSINSVRHDAMTEEELMADVTNAAKRAGYPEGATPPAPVDEFPPIADRAEALARLTKDELQDAARIVGAPVTGTKADIMEAILEAEAAAAEDSVR